MQAFQEIVQRANERFSRAACGMQGGRVNLRARGELGGVLRYFLPTESVKAMGTFSRDAKQSDRVDPVATEGTLRSEDAAVRSERDLAEQVGRAV